MLFGLFGNKKDFNRKLADYDEANHTEDIRLRNAQEDFLERLNDEEKSITIAKYHAVRKEINDNE